MPAGQEYTSLPPDQHGPCGFHRMEQAAEANERIIAERRLERLHLQVNRLRAIEVFGSAGNCESLVREACGAVAEWLLSNENH